MAELLDTTTELVRPPLALLPLSSSPPVRPAAAPQPHLVVELLDFARSLNELTAAILAFNAEVASVVAVALAEQEM